MQFHLSRAIPALITIACTACATAAAEPSVTSGSAASELTEHLVEPDPQLAGVDAVLDVGGRLTVLASGAIHEEALLSADGRTAVVVDRTAASTWLGWVDTSTGEVVAATELAGELEAVAVDPRARFVGLVDVAPEREADAIAAGRSSTTLVVASADGELFRSELFGNIVPEAFSDWTTPDGSGPGSAFVIDYQPPELPTHYRVRVLDLATGELGLPVNLRDKVQPVDQLMAGISRTSVVAAGEGLLFTLYRGHHDEGTAPYAFIHTLAFGNGVWCLEVPAAMELAEQSGALVVSPDGEHLIAVSANGTVARIAIDDILDVEALPIFEDAIRIGPESHGVPAVAAGEDGVAIAWGTTVVVLDSDHLSVRARAELPVTVESLGADGSGFVAAGEGRLIGLDGTLSITAESSVPADLGPVARIVAD